VFGAPHFSIPPRIAQGYLDSEAGKETKAASRSKAAYTGKRRGEKPKGKTSKTDEAASRVELVVGKAPEARHSLSWKPTSIVYFFRAMGISGLT